MEYFSFFPSLITIIPQIHRHFKSILKMNLEHSEYQKVSKWSKQITNITHWRNLSSTPLWVYLYWVSLHLLRTTYYKALCSQRKNVTVWVVLDTFCLSQDVTFLVHSVVILRTASQSEICSGQGHLKSCPSTYKLTHRETAVKQRSQV